VECVVEADGLVNPFVQGRKHATAAHELSSDGRFQSLFVHAYKGFIVPGDLSSVLLEDRRVIGGRGGLSEALDFLFRDDGFLEGGEDLTNLLLEDGPVLHKLSVVGVDNIVVHVLAEDGNDPLFRVSFHVGAGQDDFIVVVDAVSFDVEVTVDLEEPCLQLGALSSVEVGLVGTASGATSMGGVGSVHCDIAHLGGVQSVKV
jgi:hypothetical protein